ncbi:hypothetical protein RDABS01_018624, partial [Bienertia sinuspersici]
SGRENVQERLDRFFANNFWKNIFPGSYVSHLSKRRSDHIPILMNVKGPTQKSTRKKRRKIFRFEEMWVRDESINAIIESEWNMHGDVKRKNLSNSFKAEYLEQGHEGKWKVNTLNDIFSKWECEEIQKIVLPQSQLEDVWTWHHIKNELFSVKSAYFIAQQEKGSAGPALSSDQRDEVWDKVWRAKVPPKIKIFAWKSIHNGLVVRCNLAKKGMEVDPICPRCGESLETELHMLFSCKEARYVWYYSPLHLECNIDGSASVYEWVRGLMRHFETDEWWSLFWSLAWGIWLQRNGWIFEQKCKPHILVIQRAVSMVGDYEKANEKPTGGTPSEGQATWKPPEESCYKINSDATIFSDGRMGMGGVIRDYIGDVMAATCCCERGRVAPDVAEAMAARHAIKIAYEAAGHTTEEGKGDPTIFGAIVNDIIAWGRRCTQFATSFVRRSGNRVAHALAHYSCNGNENTVWIEEVPQHIQDLVSADSYAMNT